MVITHAKVSGLTNPADLDLVGGEDWDADHVVTGMSLINACGIILTTAGAILTQTNGIFSFTKQATGTYRALYDPDGWGGFNPFVIATISTASGAPKYIRTTLGNNGTSDYIEVATIDVSGTAVDLASGSLNVAVFAVVA